MAKRTRYDELHDRYFEVRTTKSGTRYERLAAFVFKALEENGVVIHDITLKGDTGAEHQIDVHIEKDGDKKRILIECKDFDISGNKVGLDIIRNFWAVVDDTKPDEAIVITCNDFTKDAQIYARGKCIKLAILRDFREEDWEGKVRTIAITMRILSVAEPRVEIVMGAQEHKDKFRNDMIKAGIQDYDVWKRQPVFINLPEERIQLNDFIEAKVNEYPRNNPGLVEYKIPLANTTIEVGNYGGVPIDGVVLRFEVFHSQEYFEVTSKKIAELIIKGLQDDDLIIFDEDLKRFTIDQITGEVIPKQ